jgi:acyl-CoA synthetase (AMP-forming)/AMP-acid ligase II
MFRPAARTPWAYARTADLAEEVATNSASSSDRSDAAPPAAETSPATGPAICLYIESMTESLRQTGERPVLRWEDASTTGSELLAAIYRYARALESLGIARGDLVAMYAPNRPEALALRYATHLLGAASVYLSAPPDPGKRAQMLVDYRPRLVVVFPETAHLLPPTTAPCGAIGPVEEVPLHLDELASGQDPAPMASRARQDDFAVVVSSGGTTGVPKGSVRDFSSYTKMVAVPNPATRRQLANGKLSYLTQALVDTTLLGGGTVILQSTFQPASTLAAIETERVTHLFLVEPQLFDLMDHPDVTHYDLSSLSVLTHIGAAARSSGCTASRCRGEPPGWPRRPSAAASMGLRSAGHAALLPDDFLDRFAVVGPAEQCAERLRELIDLGLDRIIMVPASRDAAPELVVESNGRFTDHVLPRLRR